MSLIASSVYPDEMPHFVAFHQSFHSLLKYAFMGNYHTMGKDCIEDFLFMMIIKGIEYTVDSLVLYSSHSINLRIYGLHFLVAKLQI